MNYKPIFQKIFLFANLLLITNCAPKDNGINVKFSVFENGKIILQNTISTPWQKETTVTIAPYSFTLTPHLANKSEIKIKMTIQKDDQSWGEGNITTYSSHLATFDIINGETKLRTELIPIKVVRK